LCFIYDVSDFNIFFLFILTRRYLHHEASPHIIHRDIKASNVLLDVNFQAKVADFGFAKLIPDGVTHMTTRVKGTLGYLAPDDVYSFGILLLELISAKRPLEKLPGGIKRDIIQWVTPYIQKGAIDHIADPRLKGKFDRSQLKLAVMVAIRCTDANPENRPIMTEVVEWLKGNLAGRRPKQVSYVEDDMDEDDEDDETDDTNDTMESHKLRVERSFDRRNRAANSKAR
ncbi:unnamed protein product, partial [Linum tenue]